MALAVILLVIGISVYCYPYFTNWKYQREVEQKSHIFMEQTEKEQKNYEALYQLFKEENKKLFQEKQKNLTRAAAYENANIDLHEYGIDVDYVGFIKIPKMNIHLPIYLGASEEHMKKGAAHLTETSYPIGGKHTNCVLAAHRGYSKAAMFREIETLQEGDLVYIETFWGILTYRVRKTLVVWPTDVDNLYIREDEDLLTLITCHPYRQNSQRYLVICENISEVLE